MIAGQDACHFLSVVTLLRGVGFRDNQTPHQPVHRTCGGAEREEEEVREEVKKKSSLRQCLRDKNVEEQGEEEHVQKG